MSLTKVTNSMIEGAPANVLDYGADPTGVADSSAAFEAAIATNRRVRVPSGTYKCNVTIEDKLIIEGDGSLSTILKPFDDNIAVMTYTFTAQQNPLFRFWDYHSEVRNIGFFSNSAKTGVGFTFGKTDPSNYATNDQSANNVKFYGCLFEGLDKGIQFPFGNIGTEVYSCGFKNNYYGVYMLNNKFSADQMHNGNKYFYAGEFSSNTCAVYGHNAQGGYGGITFDNVILEFNDMAVYLYNTINTFAPPEFRNCWFETNGSLNASGNITIDSWSGSTKSTQSVPPSTLRFDGTRGEYLFNGGFFTGAQVVGQQIRVIANNVVSSVQSGTRGEPCSALDDLASIVINNPSGPGQLPSGKNIVVTGRPKKVEQISDNPTQASQSWFNIAPRLNKITSSGASRVYSASGTSVISTGNGSFNLTGTVVSDGQLYATCNEFTRAAFASNQFTRVNSPDSVLTLSAGFYVLTFDAKVTVGDVIFNWWNRSTQQAAKSMRCATLNDWYSFAAIAQAAGGESIYFDFQGTGVDATWRVAAIQIHYFDTLLQAQNFLASGVFAES